MAEHETFAATHLYFRYGPIADANPATLRASRKRQKQQAVSMPIPGSVKNEVMPDQTESNPERFGHEQMSELWLHASV